jgi:hypothetical protein
MEKTSMTNNTTGRARALELLLAAVAAVAALTLASCSDSAETSASDTTADGDASMEGAMDAEAMGDMDDDEMEGMDHDHDGGHEVTWSPRPSVSVTATEVAPGTFDLSFDLESFTLVDVSTAPEPVEGEGHVHVYIDGRGGPMVYIDTHRLEDIPPGEHEIRVELSAADHQPWLIDGEPVDGTTTVTVEGEVAAADQVIEVTVADGSVTGGADRHRVGLGEVVAFTVSSDMTDEIHVHGYDLYGDVEAGDTATVEFTADIPGVFEIELEEAGLKLAELEVS